MTQNIDNFSGKYRYLSNFWLCQVPYQGIAYPSSEHAYQAAKSLDWAERLRISTAKTCREAKRLGQSLLLRSDWEAVKVEVMREVLWNKFTDNLTLLQRLMQTDDVLLIEDNTWGDTFWGECDGKGQNHLGRLLMEIREASR